MKLICNASYVDKILEEKNKKKTVNLLLLLLLKKKQPHTAVHRLYCD